jgi:hypothetical protein
MSQGAPPACVTYSPLAVLLFSGLYALVLPYADLCASGDAPTNGHPPHTAAS